MFMKIFTQGHEIPSDEIILSFKRAVQRFLRDNADNGPWELVSDKHIQERRQLHRFTFISVFFFFF